MTKSPDAFKTISEVADELKLPQHVLRFWETRFSQIKPMKRGGGRRYYRPDDLSLLRGIRHLLYSEGYTIKGVQRILKEQGARHVATQWFDADENQSAEQLHSPSLAAQPATVQAAPAEPAQAPIPVPPTATMQPVENAAEPVAAPPLPVQAAAQPPMAPQAAPVAAVVAQQPAPHPVAPAQLASPQQIAPSHTAQPQATGPTVQPSEPQKQAVMPPFAVTHGAPAHLVDAITPTSTLVEPVAMDSEDKSGRNGDTVPADILADDEKGGGIAKSLGMGLLGKITGSDDGDAKKHAQSILPKGDIERLQATLVDLLECKRLLDQIR